MSGWPDLLNVALGCWLFLSPFFLGHFEEMSSSMNAYIVGSILAVLAAHARKEYHVAEEIIVALAALWLVVSPWALGFAALTQAGAWNAVLTGIAALALAGWSAMSDHGPIAPEAA